MLYWRQSKHRKERDMKVTLLFPDREPMSVSARQWATIEDIIAPYLTEAPYPIYLARMNNRIADLTTKVGKGSTIELLDLRSQAANMTYQASLIMLYLRAVEKVLGRTPVEIDYSLNKGLLTRIRKKYEVTPKQVEKIERAMRKMVREDIPIRQHTVSRRLALLGLDNFGLTEKRRLLERAKDVKRVNYFSMGGFVNLFYCYMVPSTRYLQYFELRHYRGEEVLLRFPHAADPVKIPEYEDDELLYEAFGNARHWQDLLGIDYVTDLNKKIERGEMEYVIQLSEALHEKHIVEIANEITRRKKRIILIAGPSSSGKTTFAHRLCVQLAVNGHRPLYLGTDDYFMDREQTPVNEKGEKDYESLAALDVALFNEQLNGLLAGEEVDIPSFDFLLGRKIFGTRVTRIDRDQPIVIEGIHALNDALTHQIPSVEKYKIYISPLTQLNIDEHNRVPTTDARLLRRMVRDYQYRGYSARETIKNWPKVRAGEEKNIFPFNNTADCFFNSVHIYEMAVLKRYAKPLLKRIRPTDPEYAEAQRLLMLLDFFNVYRGDDIVVNNSILREFIGGNIFYR